MFLIGCGLLVQLAAAEALPTIPWKHVTVAPSKTSIYVGSVTLKPGVLTRDGTTLTADYEVTVRPWFFWGETGSLTLEVPVGELEKLAKGERAEFTGNATNHKNKPRQVTGYAEPADATHGKFKVRILADGYTLIFNATYELTP